LARALRLLATVVLAIATIACGIGGVMAVVFGATPKGDVLDNGSVRVLMMGVGITLILTTIAGGYGLLRLWRR